MVNVHERAFEASPSAAGALIDSLSSPDDRLWPTVRWPAMRLDRGLKPGSNGGPGPVRYRVARHTPAREIAFTFTEAFPIEGEHRFEVLPGGGIRHTLEGKPRGYMVAAWPLCFRWLHDALIEDSLDRAEAQLRNERWTPRRLPPHVRGLRRLLARSG